MSEPRITRQALHDDGPGNIPPTRVVIHATSPLVGYPHASEVGKAASTAVYFTSKAAGGSAHYVADLADEQHCVPDAHIAWHAPPNPHSIGIEVCAETEYTRAQWLSPQVWPAVARAAARTRELCQRFGIPMTRLSVADLLAGHHGICGHMDVSAAWHQSSHSDPGPGFPWTEFMAAVLDAPAGPSLHRKDEPMSAIPLTFYNDNWQVDPNGLNFRGAFAAEEASNSQVVKAMFVRWGSFWGGVTGWLICSWNTGSDTTPGGKPGAHADLSQDWWRVPEGARSFTVQGRRANPGVVPYADVIVQTV